MIINLYEIGKAYDEAEKIKENKIYKIWWLTTFAEHIADYVIDEIVKNPELLSNAKELKTKKSNRHL